MKLSDAELNYIREHFPTTKTKVIAAKLNRAPVTITNAAKRMGAKKAFRDTNNELEKRRLVRQLLKMVKG